MKKYSEIIFKRCTWLAVACCCLFTACEKEHLQPDTITGSETPLVFINAILGTDTVHLEGGVNSYIGASWVADTGIYRYFCFYLYSTLSPQPMRCFKIYVNNAALTSGNPQQDLDSTITVDSLGYQNYSNGFSPSSATVEWYDSTGVQYTSSIVSQSNTFVITSVED